MPHLIAMNPASPHEHALPALPAARWMVGAYVGGEVTGFVQACDGPFDRRVETTLFVHIKWRRQGIGTLLLEAAMDWARLRDARALRLVCARTDWATRHFAEKRGARLDLAFGQIVADIPLGRCIDE